MAQYDLLLIQNIAPSGTEFSEQLVNLPKGAILSGGASGVPTVLDPGTNTYMLVADSTQNSGLKWQAVSGGHTQNTDVGTTSAIFELDSTASKIELTAESSSKFGVKVDGGATYADIQAKDATFNKVTVSTAPSAGTDLTNKTYVDGILASADAMIYKGTIGTGGTHTIAAFNALTTYDAGWTYRVIEAGTVRGVVCEIGDLVTVLVDRTGSGNLNSDFTIIQTNLDGAVIGPASTTDNYVALFSGTTGKLLKAGTGALGTAAYTASTAYATSAQGTLATNAIPKGTITGADQIVYGIGASTPAALTVGASTFVGKKSTGSLVAMTPAEARTELNVADGANNYVHPTTAGNIHIPTGGATTQVLQWSASGTAKWVTLSSDISVADNGAATISNGAVTLAKMANMATASLIYRKTGGTGVPEVNSLATLKTDLGGMPIDWVAAPATKTSTGSAGQAAYDSNYIYVCTGTNVWKRCAIATNW